MKASGVLRKRLGRVERTEVTAKKNSLLTNLGASGKARKNRSWGDSEKGVPQASCWNKNPRENFLFHGEKTN